MPKHSLDAELHSLDGGLLAEIESSAVDMARKAGDTLARHFGRKVEIQYKDDGKTDPVSAVDRESQDLLERSIRKRFPSHSVLGEEGDEDGPVADFVWVLDPLDGTKNFLDGLPIYACSVGVMYHGAPVAGAVYVPWPAESQGLVLHARLGAGAFANGAPLERLEAAEPRSNRLVTLPGGFGRRYRFDSSMRGKVGDVRMTGSIAYELAMVAKGVLQYSMTNAPRLWDVGAGVVLVREAGGLVMVGGESRRLGVLTTLRWEPMETLWPAWQTGETTLKELRGWSAPMVYGGAEAVRSVTASIGIRRRARWSAGGGYRAVRRLLRPRGGSAPISHT